MKLQKSVEKAEQLRAEANRKSAQEASPTEKTEPNDQNVLNDSNDQNVLNDPKKIHAQEWTPPVYSESKAIELDLDKLAKNRCVSLSPDAPEAEFYKVVRTNIQHRTRENNWNAIMITSVQAGEGKTLTAVNLAITFAKEYDQTVLLVDCDMKRQNVRQLLNISSEKGIVDYLVDDCPLKDLIIWPGIEKLTLISGGKTMANSAELLGSPRMKAFVREIKNRYDDRYIIFDTPPVLGPADAIAFAPFVDCILMVVEEGRTSIKNVNEALGMIPKEKFLGFVLNRRTSLMQKYYY
jgi:non-specific protein-tyrosine kinase